MKDMAVVLRNSSIGKEKEKIIKRAESTARRVGEDKVKIKEDFIKLEKFIEMTDDEDAKACRENKMKTMKEAKEGYERLNDESIDALTKTLELGKVTEKMDKADEWMAKVAARYDEMMAKKEKTEVSIVVGIGSPLAMSFAGGN